MAGSTDISRWQSDDPMAADVTRAVPQAVFPVLERAARGGVFPDPNAPAPEEAHVRSAVTLAIGRECRRLELVSASAVADRREVLERDTYAVTLSEAIERQLGFGLSLSLGGQRWRELRGKFGYDEPVRLAEFLAAAESRIPRENVRAAMFAATGFVFAGELHLASRLLPLLRLLPSAVPLGERRGQPGSWIVIVP